MHLPFDMDNQNLGRSAYRAPTWYRRLTYNTPIAQAFFNPLTHRYTGFRLNSIGLHIDLRVRIGIYNATVLKHPTGNALSYCQLVHIPYKLEHPDGDYLFYPIPPVWLEGGKWYSLVAYGDPSRPDDAPMGWAGYERPPVHAGEYSYYGVKENGFWSWHISTTFTGCYELYLGTGYVQPCEVMPPNISL